MVGVAPTRSSSAYTLTRRAAVVRRLLALLLVGLLSLSGIAHAGARQDDPAPRYKLIPLGTIKNYPGTVALALNAKGWVVGQAAGAEFDGGGRAVVYRSGKLRALIKGEKNVSSTAQDINAKGQIIVITTGFHGETQSLLWESDAGTPIGPTDGGVPVFASAIAIGDSGVVVGRAIHFDSPAASPFVWQDGEFTELGLLNDAVEGAAYNVNADGLVVGFSAVAAVESGSPSVTHAVVWDDGEITDLGTLGGEHSVAHAVNEAGQIVGRSATAEGQTTGHATLWQNGEIADLGTLPDGEASSASAINAQGDIVGRSTNGSGELSAVLWHDGELYDLNDLVEGGSEVVLENAYDINDSGLIIAIGRVDGLDQSFLLEPVEA